MYNEIRTFVGEIVMVKHDTLLICSSLREHRREIRSVFADSFNLLESGDVRQFTLLLNQNISCIAAVLLDVSDWKQSDSDWLESQQNHMDLRKVPVIILSESDTPDLLNRAFELGAADVIPIGYDPYAMLQHLREKGLHD